MRRVPNVRTHAWLDAVVGVFWRFVATIVGAARAIAGDDE
jgi:hypothetical protein